MFSFHPDTPAPRLVEPGTRYFLNETLKKCSEFREKYKNQLFNLGIFITFIVLLCALLMYKYKGKPSAQEKHIQENNKKQYILSTIKNYQDAKRTAQQQLITGLPQWDNEYEAIMQNRGPLRHVI